MFWNILQPIIGPIIEKLVDRIPNPNERAKAKEQFEMELMQAVMSASTQQNKINEIEAAHKKCFCCRMAPFYRLDMRYRLVLGFRSSTYGSLDFCSFYTKLSATTADTYR